MSIFWLRVALGFYGVGLLYALVALTRTSDLLNRVALHAAYLGMVLHLVSLTEGVFLADIGVIFTGCAALLLSRGASVLYLMQQRSLRAKRATSIFSRLSALEDIGQIVSRSLLLCFSFMTLGLIACSVVAESTYVRI